MNVAIWVVQGLLAFAFFVSGGMKVLRSKEAILASQGEQMGWVNDFNQTQLRLIGIAEVLGAIGLILPMALDIAPVLTPIAAIGLILVMSGAIATHMRRQEPVYVNLVLGGMALFIVVGRFFIEAVI